MPRPSQFVHSRRAALARILPHPATRSLWNVPSWTLLCSVLVLGMLGLGCVGTVPRPTAPTSPVRTVTDGSGRQLTVPARPQRIASQTLATDEILLALVAPERLVALSNLADDARYSYCAEPAKLVAGRCGANAEAILQLQPDLILVASYSRAELVELLSASGAPVYRFTRFGGVADIKSNILALGDVVGEPTAAAELVAELERRFAILAERARQRGQHPRLMSFGVSHFTAGTETSFDDLVRAIGGINVAAEQGVVGFRQISPEQLTRWKPDFIVVSAESGKEDLVRQRLLEDPAVIAAVGRDANRIIVVESRAFTTVSQHLADAAEHLESRIFASVGMPPRN
ncbi:MAG: ABC transporter substrate-binding protein [Chloracidobacterium sp.]|uniref:ABC transporter substrate-binding protein n=1 Tax=Chloracidobacterium validum TaxID=2821543 RepID=A0ABX8BC12_9BACT|nr:ABC transporter substrate-binding protein [Chloracidobacterium validum]QUW04216.1 ABC transporter substrate-binding protein [Chloracidobacterium validum]